MNMIIPSEAVAPRTYFLESLNTPGVIWGIRIVAFLLLLSFIVYYLCHRDR
jgi:hypothetical protein